MSSLATKNTGRAVLLPRLVGKDSLPLLDVGPYGRSPCSRWSSRRSPAFKPPREASNPGPPAPDPCCESPVIGDDGPRTGIVRQETNDDVIGAFATRVDDRHRSKTFRFGDAGRRRTVEDHRDGDSLPPHLFEYQFADVRTGTFFFRETVKKVVAVDQDGHRFRPAVVFTFFS